MPHKFNITDEINTYTLATEDNLYEELLASVRLEEVGKGRRGAVLVKVHETRGTPIVRTTTRYLTPAQPFGVIHENLAQQIQKIASLSHELNNALIENYTNAYTTMGSHSDQALDLVEESSIAIFSCYQYPALKTPLRKLIVERKDSSDDTLEIPLSHNSVIVFSLNTNRKLRHKIVLNASSKTPENPWLGLTFRTSKTYMHYRHGHAYFPDNSILTLANQEQRQEFYSLRRRENQETDFTYPHLTYTLSESDRMPPEPVEK